VSRLRLSSIGTLVVLVVSALSFVATSAATELRASASTPLYYVALGDSLAAGVGASSPAKSYVELISSNESATFPGLQLQNFACPGASTATMVNGPNCGSPTSQLATAEAFLRAHSGNVAFATIDIGANDVDGCIDASGIDSGCVASGIQAIDTNLPTILSGLEAADPGIKLVGMNYYDPYLATWLTGSSGQQLAQESLTYLDQLNTVLTQAFSGSGFPTADVATAFDSHDFALTGSFNGQTIPQNVANICLWTHMCTSLDIHANDAGHAVLASTFEKVLAAEFPTTTTTTTTTTSIPATTEASVQPASSTRTSGAAGGAGSSSATNLAVTGPGTGLRRTAITGGLMTVFGTALTCLANRRRRPRRRSILAPPRRNGLP
jgi:lysophospholipase L1-like esterase